MKKITLAILFGMTISASAQNKKDLTVALGTGFLTSPYYLNDKAGGFYNVDFEYHLTKRQILSTNYNSGAHSYYSYNLWSINATPPPKNITNSEVKYRTFSILYKYRLLDRKSISATLGTGAGIMTHSRTYPYTTSTSSSYYQSSWSDLVFPVRLDLDYKLSQQFKLGLMGGFFIHPDFPILAYHGGARLSFTLK